MGMPPAVHLTAVLPHGLSIAGCGVLLHAWQHCGILFPWCVKARGHQAGLQSPCAELAFGQAPQVYEVLLDVIPTLVTL